MTAEEQIEYIAINILGWTKEEGVNVELSKQTFSRWQVNDDEYEYAFNPLEDWNDWRMVEEKVMEERTLFIDYLNRIGEGYEGPSVHVDIFIHLHKSTLEQRVDALISAYQSIYS